jgi:hypothetical protein
MSDKYINADTAYDYISSQSQQMYDHRVVILLGNYLRISDKTFASNYLPVKLGELKDGMILGREIITDKGHKLLNSGATLTTSTIAKIIAHSAADPIIGNIFVEKQH